MVQKGGDVQIPFICKVKVFLKCREDVEEDRLNE